MVGLWVSNNEQARCCGVGEVQLLVRYVDRSNAEHILILGLQGE